MILSLSGNETTILPYRLSLGWTASPSSITERKLSRNSAAAFVKVTELYKFTESCNYREIEEELIRDRLVFGIKDSTLSEQLQL